MARGYYETGVLGPSLTVAAAVADLLSGASVPLRVTEIGLSVSLAGAAPTLALVRSTAVGTQTTPSTPQAQETADPASTAKVATVWSVAPTLAATSMRRVTLSANVGAGWVWAWSESNPLIVPVSASIVINMVAISAAVATQVNVYFKHLE
jgi:hypothetical protein